MIAIYANLMECNKFIKVIVQDAVQKKIMHTLKSGKYEEI
jgi:hypothetical protein